MDMEYLQKETLKSKILITGLDDAGKTTIILALQREFSKISLIKPTRGAQRRMFSFLGKDISEWDLGGQASYRISYLKSPNKYFDKTEVAIYVIDIQNNSRISEALSYLNDVVIQFNILQIEPPIFIFFHKFDPILIKKGRNFVDNISEELSKRINNIPYGKKFYFFKTSIYDLSTIIKAMSEIFLSLYDKVDLIQKTILQFALRVKSQGCVIIDENSLIIGSYYADEGTREVLSNSTPYFLSLNSILSISPSEGELKEDIMVIQRFGKYFFFRRFFLKAGTPPFYLLLTKLNPEFNSEEFIALINLLKEIIYK